MKHRLNIFSLCRRIIAALSLLAMIAVFFIPAAARWLGWLPRLQLVPAILAGAVLELIVLAVFVALFGRLYCSILCPLGILQDLFRFGVTAPLGRVKDAAETSAVSCAAPLGRVKDAAETSAVSSAAPLGSTKDAAETKSKRSPMSSKSSCRKVAIFRMVPLALFLLSIPFGLTGILEPYGIFGRFLATGIRQAGEPAAVTVVWSLGLVAGILILSLFRARFWCNRICPVGTILGLFSRFALFRVRIDSAACVKCGACARSCDKGALAVRADKSIAIDHSSCVACGNCLTACPRGALSLFRSGRNIR